MTIKPPKACCCCKQVLERTVENFNRNKAMWDGFSHYCRGCSSQAKRESYWRKKLAVASTILLLCVVPAMAEPQHLSEPVPSIFNEFLALPQPIIKNGEQLESWTIYGKAFAGICPICKIRNMKSDVFPGITIGELAWTVGHYDSQGIYIPSEDPNKYTTDMTCSNGHHFKWVHTAKDSEHAQTPIDTGNDHWTRTHNTPL